MAAATGLREPRGRERSPSGRAGSKERAFRARPHPGGSGAGSLRPPPELSNMPDTSAYFDFKKRVAYDAEAKRRFHRHARAQLLEAGRSARPSNPTNTTCAPTRAASPSAARSRCTPIGFMCRRANRRWVPISASSSARARGGATTPAGATISRCFDAAAHRPDELAAADPPSCPSPAEGGARMSSEKLSPAVLAQFTGSEHWYRHGLVRGILFTDGAKYVADQGGALLAASMRSRSRSASRKAVAAEEFQVWKLTVNPDRSAQARLRGRQRPHRLREGNRIHRLPGRRHRALVREQHDLSAERA